ncbi:MAG: hemolysin III family protein [Acidobacteriota bacterium]
MAAPAIVPPVSSAPRIPSEYGFGEELAHSVTHGIGIVLSIVGLAVLVSLALARGQALHVATCAVYGTTLILLYLASTLYHSISLPRAKRVLRVLDHCAIYLLIAGTYTPFALVSLHGARGWVLFAVVWALAIAGMAFKSVATGRARIFSVVLYLLLGWCALSVLSPLSRAIPAKGMALLFAGGASYTLGVVFYAWKRLPYHHAIWHLFVLAGSIFHFFAVLVSVIPA